MLTVDFSYAVHQFRVLTKRLADELRARVSEGAERVGIAVLGEVQDAYNAKARHGTGSDGITWKELSPKTLEARVRRRAAARRIVEERRQLSQEIRGILSGGIVPRSKRGKQKAISPTIAVEKLRQKRKDLSRKLANLVIKEMSAYEIGVDTGLQHSSASPGFDDPNQVWTKAPSDNLGNNVFIIDGGSVTIGYDRSYSAAFDSVRPLMPDKLPDPWMVEAETAAATWADLVVSESLELS